MGGFGDLLGLGDLVRGLSEAVRAGGDDGEREGNAEGYDSTSTVDRVLAGARRELNVNDR